MSITDLKFCSHCGAPLVTSTEIIGHGYDPKTGQPETYTRTIVRCPSYSFPFGLRHDSYSSNNHPEAQYHDL